MFQREQMSTRFLGSIAIATVILLTGCAAIGNEATESPFSGPYADVFQEELKLLTDEKQRAYLEDSKISEAEFQAVVADFTSCLDSRGVTFQGYDEYGASEMEGDPSRVANKDLQSVIGECSDSTGEPVIAGLYFMLKRDPAREITPQTTVDCMVRAGVVPAEFTTEDFSNGELDRLYPPEFLYEPPGEDARIKIQNCDNDPMHAYTEK